MEDLAQLLCVFVSLTGSVYCLILLRNCRRRLHALKRPAEASLRAARGGSADTRSDCLCQILLAGVFLAVAMAVLAGFSFQAAPSLLLDRAGGRQQRFLETVSIPGCPPVLVAYGPSRSGHPIVGIDCTNKPISDDQLHGLLYGKPALAWLILTGTDVTSDGLRELQHLPELRQVSLNGTRICDRGLHDLATLKNLDSLFLDRTKITDAGLRSLADATNLQNLSLSETAVTDAGLECLRRLDRLAFLDLCGTRVTEAGVNRLRRELPGAVVYWEPRGLKGTAKWVGGNS